MSCLMRMLSKEELEGAIMLDDLCQILSNFGLEDQFSNDSNSLERDESSIVETSFAKQPTGGKGGADISKLDDESIEIMAMLLLYCIKN